MKSLDTIQKLSRIGKTLIAGFMKVEKVAAKKQCRLFVTGHLRIRLSAQCIPT